VDRDDSLRWELETETTELARLLGQPRELVRALAKQQIGMMRVTDAHVELLNRHMERNIESDDFTFDKTHTVKGAVEGFSGLMRLERYERRALSALRKLLLSLEKDES
jgi:hypothetical protein